MASVMRHIKINYHDADEVVVGLPPKVQIQFEDHFNMSLADMSRASHMYWLAWAAAKHANKETREFDEFLDVIIDVEPVTSHLTEVAANGERPTLPAQ
jgi:hypothetical protein